jgi:hypothetical protein
LTVEGDAVGVEEAGRSEAKVIMEAQSVKHRELLSKKYDYPVLESVLFIIKIASSKSPSQKALCVSMYSLLPIFNGILGN